MSHRPFESHAVALARTRLEAYLSAHRSTAVRFAGRFFPSREDAEDAVAEAAFRAVRAAHQYDPEKKFDAWFTHILKMVCLETLRARKAKKNPLLVSGEATSRRGESLDSITLLEAQVDPGADIERLLELKPAGCWIEGVYVSLRVAQALLALNPMQRGVVVNLYLCDPALSQAETATKMGISESQVKALAKEARGHLTTLLGEGGR